MPSQIQVQTVTSTQSSTVEVEITPTWQTINIIATVTQLIPPPPPSQVFLPGRGKSREEESGGVREIILADSAGQTGAG